MAGRYSTRPIDGTANKEWELWDEQKGELLRTGTYDRMQADAAELNRQSDSALYNQGTAVSPTVKDDSGAGKSAPTPTGTQPTVLGPDQVGSNGQKITKPNTTQNSNNLGTNAEVPGRRTYNPLSKFSSYNYILTLYLVDPAAMNIYVQTGGVLAQSKTSGFYVVAQSGGINNNKEPRAITYSGIPGDGDGFDYYIDDLQFTIVSPGKDSSNTATADIDFTFKITEVTGFNFLTSLSKAANYISKTSPIISGSNAPSPEVFQQHFMIGIKFYGYDANGKLVTSKDFQDADVNGVSATTTTDSNASFERFYPLIVSHVTFKIDGRAVVYNFTAQGLSFQAANGEKRGLVKQNTELFGATIEDFLVGKNGPSPAEFWQPINSGGVREQSSGVVTQSTPPPQGRTPSKSKLSLLDVIQDQWNNDKASGKTTIVPQYWIEFQDSDPSIKNARIVVKDSQSGGSSGATRTSQSNANASKNANQSDQINVKYSVAAGTPIIQVIDDLISQSSFVDDALKLVNSDKPEVTAENKNASKVLKWYSINPVVTIKGRDPKLNDWVYNVCYQVQTYDVPYVRSPYKAISDTYYGPHKRYEYWYTGKNTEIIEYAQNYDSLYYIISSTAEGLDNSNDKNDKTTGVPIATQGGSGGRITGPKTNRAGLINQDVRSSLYSPGDQSTATIKIMGDPDYLMQTVLSSSSLNAQYSKRYGKDYTLNPNGGQMFIQINFNNATDYDPDIGLLRTNNLLQFFDDEKLDAAAKATGGGIIYMITQCTSNFSGGKFTQTLDLVLADTNLLNLGNTSTNNNGREAAVNPASTGNDARKSNTPNAVNNKLPPGTNVEQQAKLALAYKAAVNSGNAASSPRTKTTNTGPVANDDGNNVGQGANQPL